MLTWLTVLEIGQRLGRPPTTIRSWRDAYRTCVPERHDERGRQTYPLERLAEIQQLRAQRLSPREVIQEMTRRHGSPEEEVVAPATLDQVLDRLDQIESKVDWLVERERARSED